MIPAFPIISFNMILRLKIKRQKDGEKMRMHQSSQFDILEAEKNQRRGYMAKSRMRTIRESLALIKEMDAESAITYNFIKGLCKNKSITSFSLGRKILLNYDELLKYLQIEEE